MHYISHRKCYSNAQEGPLYMSTIEQLEYRPLQGKATRANWEQMPGSDSNNTNLYLNQPSICLQNHDVCLFKCET